MTDSKSTANDSRRADRHPLDAAVTIDIAALSFAGSGENISQQGVYFTAEATVPVAVRIGDTGKTVRGHLVRFESMGNGRIGVAIRFDEPITVPPAS